MFTTYLAIDTYETLHSLGFLGSSHFILSVLRVNLLVGHYNNTWLSDIVMFYLRGFHFLFWGERSFSRVSGSVFGVQRHVSGAAGLCLLVYGSVNIQQWNKGIKRFYSYNTTDRSASLYTCNELYISTQYKHKKQQLYTRKCEGHTYSKHRVFVISPDIIINFLFQFPFLMPYKLNKFRYKYGSRLLVYEFQIFIQRDGLSIASLWCFDTWMKSEAFKKCIIVCIECSHP